MISAIAHKINYDNITGLFTEGLMVTGAGGCEGKIHKLEEVLGTNYIDRADCENETPPMVFNEISPYLVNTTFVRSLEQKRNGTYSYKIVKTIASGTSGQTHITDNISIVDMHGLEANKMYALEVWVYIPSASGILASEIAIEIYDYDGGWVSSYAQPTLYDMWEKITVTRTIRAGATGVQLRLFAASAPALNEYFYVDDIRLRKLEEETGSLWIVSKARELIDRGNCEDPITPMIFNEYVPSLSNATLERSTEQKRNGNSSYKIVKTIAAGSWAQVYVVSVGGGMHGLVAERIYTFKIWVYVPSASGIALDEVYVDLVDYVGSWETTSSNSPTAFDEWQKLSVTRTIRTSATAVLIRVFNSNLPELNEYFYIDDISLKNVFLDDEEITDEDTGVANVNETPIDDGFVILNNYAGTTVTGALTIERDEDYDNFQLIDDSAWTIKKTDWNGDADDLPIVDFGASVYQLKGSAAYYWFFKNMYFKNSTNWTVYFISYSALGFTGCLFFQANNVGCLYPYAGLVAVTNCVFTGIGIGNQYGIIMNGPGPTIANNVAVYGMGYAALRITDALLDNVNLGIELPNGNVELWLFGGVVRGNVKLGGKNGYTYYYVRATASSLENFQIIKGHKQFYINGEMLKKDVTIGSGDPYKRSGGADSVIEISCDWNAVGVPIPDKWKYLIFEHEFEMDTTLRNYRYYTQCRSMLIVSASELFLECEYVDQYVNTTTYHTIKIKSDEIVSQRTGVGDWTQYIEVTGIQPAIASKVRIKCYLSKYDADGRIFIDPKVELS